MKYLLDVNALIALGFREHASRQRVAVWIKGLTPRRGGRVELLTCSIAELGFVRVMSSAIQYGIDVGQARLLLLRLKKSGVLTFMADDHDMSHLPAWVKTPRQTTDGHLDALARAHGAVLATLDEHIPGAFIIPPLIF